MYYPLCTRSLLCLFQTLLELGNSCLDPLKIGTNGKGSSFEYSLANGYAEFMERLQNNMILFNRRFATKDFIQDKPVSYQKKLNEQNLIFDYYYDENEKYAYIDEVIKDCGKALLSLTRLESEQEFYPLSPRSAL